MAEGSPSRASGRRSVGAVRSLSARRPAQVWRVFSYDGLAIAVTGTRKDHLQWLSECLTPAFDVDVDPGAHCRVALVTDTARHGRLVGLGPHRDGGDAACFLLDSRIARARRWTSEGGGGVVVRGEECGRRGAGAGWP